MKRTRSQSRELSQKDVSRIKTALMRFDAKLDHHLDRQEEGSRPYHWCCNVRGSIADLMKALR